MSTEFATSLIVGNNSLNVGKDAAKEALAKLKNKKVDLCFIFGSLKYNLQEVIKGVREIIGNEPQIIGCSTSGEFTESSVRKQSVAIGLLNSDKYKFKVLGSTGLKDNANEVFEKLNKEFQDFMKLKGKTSAIIFTDGLAGNGEEASLSALSSFTSVLDIVGGAAGDDLAFKKTQVIANDQVLDDGVSVCIIKGEHTLFTGVKHGHKPISEQLTVTKSKNNVLYTVNNRPAWDVWIEKTKEEAKKIGIDTANLTNPTDIGTFLIRFELGLAIDEDYKIRVPLSKNDDGSLNFACSVPEGAMFRIMKSDKPDQISSAKTAAEIAKKELGNRKIVGTLVFDCVCRAIILGDQFSDAVDAMKKVIGEDLPLLGFETYGEICMDPTQFSGFHNTTSVLSLIAE